MAKGAEAKANFIQRIKTALGADYIGEVDKKYYVWSTENGERVQLAIALTCPKTPVATEQAAGLNFEDEDSGNGTTGATKKVAMDADEKETLERLMKDVKPVRTSPGIITDTEIPNDLTSFANANAKALIAAFDAE